MKSLQFIICSYFCIIGLSAQQLTNYKTSWIANSGGTPESHIMHSVDYMYVRPDGTAYAICGWDEGGHNVSVFKDGVQIAIPENSGTGGWGRNSGRAVYADDTYIYQLMSQHGCDGGNSNLNKNGLPQYPPCISNGMPYWNAIHRFQQNGKAASFSTGFGVDAAMLIVNVNGEAPAGITRIGNELFVSDPTGADTIKVYDAITMSSIPKRKYHIPHAGLLSADSEGNLWTLQKADSSYAPKIIRFAPADGKILSQQIVFPKSMIASSFCIDNKLNRILVTNIDVAQNVMIFTNILTSPTQSGTFGTSGGIYSGIEGQTAPLKFNNPKGIGTDDAGNIYVGCDGPVMGSATFESYKSDGTRNWILYGLTFTATADADAANLSDVYTCEKHFNVDYSSNVAGKEWTYIGYTLNKFKYPDDPRVHGIFYTSSLIRTIQGKKFLFISDMYGSNIAGYRFDKINSGETAIPCLFFTGGGWDSKSTWPIGFPNNNEWIWTDKNANGAFDANEYDGTIINNHYVMAWWVDENGGIWKGLRENGLRYFPCQGIDANGVPQYSYATSIKYPLPQGVNGVKRIQYDYAKDELYLAGFSSLVPDTGDTWWSMGSTLCQYKNVLKNGINAPAWQKLLEFYANGDNTKYNAKAFCMEGDYIFVILAKEGKIRVYNRTDALLVGEITPGAEVNYSSGWTDIDIAITARKMANGEYLLFAEENGNAKVIMYRWCPTGNCAGNNLNQNSVQVNIYPNPASKLVNIEFESNKSRKVKIISTLGVIVFEAETTQNNIQLNVANYFSGSYILNIQEGQNATNYPLVIE